MTPLSVNLLVAGHWSHPLISMIIVSEHWRMMITIALTTGLRRGELVGLEWKHVDLEKESISPLPLKAVCRLLKYEEFRQQFV